MSKLRFFRRLTRPSDLRSWKGGSASTTKRTRDERPQSHRVDLGQLEPRDRLRPRSRPAARTATPRRSPSGSRGVPGHPYEQGFDLRLWPERLELPLRWRRPKLIFVNSMSDLFHEDIPRDVHRARVRRDAARRPSHVPDPHQAPRAPRRARAASSTGRRTSGWASASRTAGSSTAPTTCARSRPRCGSSPPSRCSARSRTRPRAASTGSSPAANPGRGTAASDADWVRELRDRCAAEGVAFFFKQWGGATRSPAAASSTAAPGTRCPRPAATQLLAAA